MQLTKVESNYKKYRGKCKEFVDKAIHDDPTLVVVRGHYECWCWGIQPHWWCVKEDGSIYDPTVDQFPRPHIGEYIPFNGTLQCAECQGDVKEEYAIINGNYGFCSNTCAMRFVGL